jgi:hypothetical protein
MRCIHAILPAVCALIFVLSFKAAPQAATALASETAPPQRVVLLVSRTVEVAGYIATEDADTITIRNLRGEVESFAKSRMNQIVRLVNPEPNQRGIVVMRDGARREGVIIEDAFEHVLMEIEGIRAKLRRDAVSHIVLQRTFDQQYADAKKALRPGMYDAHLTLCQWLVNERHYELAKQEVLELLNQVDMVEARNLLNVVEAQLALMKSQPQPAPEDQAPAEDDPNKEKTTGPVYPADLMPTELISRDDVNVMRVYEIDFDHAPKVVIAPDLVRTLLEKYGTNKAIPSDKIGHTAMFRAAADRPLEIVRLMFELKARELYPQIEVRSEPYSLNMFRLRVHDTWLMNNCATSKCHGGPYAGPFFLHRRNYKDDRVRYTNLLILERLKLDPEWPLINYDKPDDSLIIQYGLPREQARKPHPKVTGWEPAFSPSNKKLQEAATEWVRSMMIPRPDYPVQYEPPRLSPGGMAPVSSSSQDAKPSR